MSFTIENFCVLEVAGKKHPRRITKKETETLTKQY